MNKTIDQEDFTRQILAIFEETFDTHHGIYLDPGTSLFETLDSITAAEASIPVGGKCACLAAQVAHVILFLEVLESYLLGADPGDVDWDHIWRTTHEVNTEEWAALIGKLHQSYLRITTNLHGLQSWDNETVIASVLGIVVHTAYHLGEIRQALCTLK